MAQEELLREAAKLGIPLAGADFKQEESESPLSDGELGAVSGGGKRGYPVRQRERGFILAAVSQPARVKGRTVPRTFAVGRWAAA